MQNRLHSWAATMRKLKDYVQWIFTLDRPPEVIEMNVVDSIFQCRQADGSIYTYTKEEVIESSHGEYNEILEWMADRDMDADLLWGGSKDDGLRHIKSMWGIKNKDHRLMFMMRWQ
jgi:hypothetical protein